MKRNALMVVSLFVVGCLTTYLTGCGEGANVGSPEDLGFEVEDTREMLADIPIEIEDEDRVETTSSCPEGYETCTLCKVNGDCEGLFPNKTVCQLEECDPELLVCILRWADVGTACGDDDLCNGAETCQDVAGEVVCAAGDPVECDDDDLCNGTESCDTATGDCVAGEAVDCDDGDACNGVETCDAGTGDCLEGEAVECGDGNLCNGGETCDPATGDCVDGEAPVCDDGDACNGEEGCDPDVGCTLGKSLTCDDGDICNGEESCDPDAGCVAGDELDCNDNNDCTDDSCFAVSGCKNSPNTNPGCCTSDAQCDDGNVCTADSCDPDSQACMYENVDGPCSDGDLCTDNDMCSGGECVAGDGLAGCAVLCSLSGPAGAVKECTLRLARRHNDESSATSLAFEVQYDAVGASLLTLIDQACFDPDNCTGINDPEDGVSLFETGHTVYLAPELPADWAGELGVSLQHVVNPTIAISPAYFEGDVLNGEAHLLSFQFELNEEIPASAPVSVILHGISAQNGAGDDLATTVAINTIVTSEEGCSGTLKLCFDAKQCTEDICNADSSCTFSPQEGACDDSNPCTLGDFCDDGDCVAQTAAEADTECTGDNLCTEVGMCDGAGVCEYDEDMAVTCDDPPTNCAAFQCDPGSGVCQLNAFAPGTGCDDGDACTENDGCDGLGACTGDLVNCDDGIVCTDDSCAGGACVNDYIPGFCDDGNDCTDEICGDDGCSYTPLDAGGCDDGNVCTLNDACAAGECTGDWDAANCGCDVDADCAPLEDGNPCTGSYACVTGACEINPSTVVTCAEYAGDCQLWSCNPGNGLCEADDADEGFECDGGGCLLNQACDAAGQCVGEDVNCDDGDACTEDSCEFGVGCVNVQDPDCETKYCVCEIQGNQGEEFTCPMLLIRESADVSPPVGADFDLSWDSALVQTAGFMDEMCLGAICLPKQIPSCGAGDINCVWGDLKPTGHSILAVPSDLVDWADHGTLLFFHPSDPFAAISDAYFGGDGTLQGEDSAKYLDAKFTLLEDVGPDNPTCLWMADPHFSLASGVSLDMKVQDTGVGRALIVY